jgi:hypothetical protein
MQDSFLYEPVTTAKMEDRGRKRKRPNDNRIPSQDAWLQQDSPNSLEFLTDVDKKLEGLEKCQLIS